MAPWYFRQACSLSVYISCLFKRSLMFRFYVCRCFLNTFVPNMQKKLEITPQIQPKGELWPYTVVSLAYTPQSTSKICLVSSFELGSCIKNFKQLPLVALAFLYLLLRLFFFLVSGMIVFSLFVFFFHKHK